MKVGTALSADWRRPTRSEKRIGWAHSKSQKPHFSLKNARNGAPIVPAIRPFLFMNQSHHVRGIAITCGRVQRKNCVDASQIVFVQLHFVCGGIVFQIFSALRAGNWNDVVSLRENPRQRQLRRRAALFFRRCLAIF